MDKYLVKRPHGIILYMFMEQFGPITQKFSENARLRISPVLPLMPVKELAIVELWLFYYGYYPGYVPWVGTHSWT